MIASMDMELSTLVDQTIPLTLKANSKFNIYPNKAYDKHFVLITVVVDRTGKKQGDVLGLLEWREEWHRFESDAWFRAMVFENKSDGEVSFDATFRTMA